MVIVDVDDVGDDDAAAVVVVACGSVVAGLVHSSNPCGNWES